MKKLIAFISIFFCNTIFADTSDHYHMIIDAGSSGSRLHVFQYHDGKSLPEIKDILSISKDEKGNKLPALSSFATHPNDAGDGLKPAFDSAAKYFTDHQIDAKQVSIDIMGTAGMRLLPQDQQDAIYSNLTQYIKGNYTFTPGQLRTLLGKEEALFGWLDVNYLNENFQRNTNTIGSIDMGGASTEIAFEVNSAADAHTKPDTYYLNLGSHAYAVFAKSYLGLGQDQARTTIMKNASANACFPTGYQDSKNNPPINGAFSQNDCSGLYQTLIQQNHLSALPAPKNNQFLAYSGFYFAFNFFNLDRTPQADLLNIQISNICTETWGQLKQDFPKIAEKYLAADCANGIYISTLLYQNYHLNSAKLIVSNQINGTDIDWPLGALLFTVTQSK